MVLVLVLVTSTNIIPIETNEVLVLVLVTSTNIIPIETNDNTRAMAACRRDSSLTERNKSNICEIGALVSARVPSTGTYISGSTVESTDKLKPWQLAEEIRH